MRLDAHDMDLADSYEDDWYDGLPVEVRAVTPDGTVLRSQELEGGFVWPWWTVPGADGSLFFGRELGTWRGPWRIEARWDDTWQTVSENS